MNIIEIKSLDQPGVELFSTLTEAQLRNRIDSQRGIFIAESPKVIRVALQAGFEPVALLCEQRHIEGDAKDIIAQCPDIPIYTGSRELLAQLTGYTLTRGVLCAMRRKPERPVAEVCKDARRVVVIQGVRSHLPFCSSIGHRCRLVDARLVRSTEPTGRPCINGYRIPHTLDVA